MHEESTLKSKARDANIQELAEAAGRLADEYRYRPEKQGFH
jgi:hypothetical protein